MKEYSERINEFAEMIKESENVVFFGGAGVSTESGIKDYRSRDGIYSTVKDYGTSPEEILSHDFFMQNPSVFYKFYGEYFLGISAKPNAAHKKHRQIHVQADWCAHTPDAEKHRIFFRFSASC